MAGSPAEVLSLAVLRAALPKGIDAFSSGALLIVMSSDFGDGFGEYESRLRESQILVVGPAPYPDLVIGAGARPHLSD